MNNNQNYLQTQRSGQANGPSACSNQSKDLPLPPAQTLLEFAHHNDTCAQQINRSLDDLRRRIFGDEPPPNPPDGPDGSPPPLERMLQSTHFDLSRALEQLEAIHKRL